MNRCQRRPRNSLAAAIASLLTLLPAAAWAGSVIGPGNSYTVNPGDPEEFWQVTDGASLIIAPGAGAGSVQVDNATFTATGFTQLGRVLAYNGSVASISGGQMLLPSVGADAGGSSGGSVMSVDTVNVISGGRGFSTSGAGSLLTVSNSTIATGGEALQVGDGALLVLNNSQVSADNSSPGAIGFGLRMYGGSAQVSNSSIAGRSGGLYMAAGSLDVTNSTIESDFSSGLNIFRQASSGAGPTVTISNTSVSGSTAANVSNSTLTARSSTLTGRGPGLAVSNGSVDLLEGTTVEGVTSAISLQGGGLGSSVLNIDQSRLISGTEAAIKVTNTANADITVSNGSIIQAGNGVLLDVNAGLVDFNVSNSGLTGNILGGPTSTLNVALSNRASLVGMITGANSVALDDAYWSLTADSTVQQLSNSGQSLIQLGDGVAFNTLTVASNYAGSGGTVLFNTVLAGDDAASDRLVIGGDSSGQTNVRVNNVGGAGAQTSRGIEIITVAGASNGQFDLAGRAVGGQYDYFLFQDAGNWYLRSQLPTAPDPCDADPTLPGCGGGVDPVDPIDPIDPVYPVDPVDPPVPVLRPEGGAYLTNLQATQTLFRLGYHDRHAGQNSGRAWARVDSSRTGFDAISRQLDVQGNSQSLSVGADVWRNDAGSGAGVMLSSGNATSTSTNPLSGYYARGKVKGEALGFYGTWRAGNAANPYAGFYVDGSVQRAQFRNRVEGVGLDAERYDSRGWQGAIETGYAFRVGGVQAGGIFLEPQLQVGYNRWDDLRHTEANGTVVTTQDADGLYGRVGLRLSGVTRWGDDAADVQPYIAANWLHTRAESQVWMDNERVDARIPRSRAEVSAGASIKFVNGFGAWAGLARQQTSGYHQTSAQLGMSYNW